MYNIIGMSTPCYPSQDGREIKMVAVLVAGEANDYSCYVGYGDPQWVAAHGDKISFVAACGHFPGGQLEEEKYRL